MESSVIFHRLLVIILLSSPLLSFKAMAQPVSTINIAAPEYWCPYACDAQDELQGFAIDIARTAFKSVNIEVNYVNKPYDRALAEVRLGKLDAVVPTFKNEAPNFIYPQQSLSSTQYCFYTVQHHWRFTGIKSINDIEFGVTSGYSYSPDMDAYIAQHKGRQVHVLHGKDIPKRMYRMTSNKRFQALLEDTRLVDFLIASKGIGNDLKRAGCIPEISRGYLALSPANEKRSNYLSQQFDKGFLAITQKNIPTLILKKYGIKEHKH